MITFNGLAVCKDGCQAIIDSASPVIAGPVEDVDQLYQHITGGCSNHNGTYEVCIYMKIKIIVYNFKNFSPLKSIALKYPPGKRFYYFSLVTNLLLPWTKF